MACPLARYLLRRVKMTRLEMTAIVTMRAMDTATRACHGRQSCKDCSNLVLEGPLRECYMLHSVSSADSIRLQG